jgi:hypothetical protein
MSGHLQLPDIDCINKHCQRGATHKLLGATGEAAADCIRRTTVHAVCQLVSIFTVAESCKGRCLQLHQHRP